MDSELQKAINDYDAGLAAGGMVSENIEPDPIVEAARKYANLDIQKGVKAYMAYTGRDERTARFGVERIIAALGITEHDIELTDDEQATLDRTLDRMENFGEGGS